nr:helicase [Calliteara abietis nucleopolyhedrovirus]
MAVTPINVNEIFQSIFGECYSGDEATLETFDDVDSLVLKLKNDDNHHHHQQQHQQRIIRSMVNFQKLIQIMSNDCTSMRMKSSANCASDHNRFIEPHNWFVRGNCFVIMVKPFIEKKYYDLIKNEIDFSQFIQSNRRGYANVVESAGDYYYWPNIPISYFGWRQYLYLKFKLNIGDYVPLIHNRKLGNVNLFEFNPTFFLNVEMSLTCNNKKLFVNGRTEFTEQHENLFEIAMADGSVGHCKVNDKLVYSNKNFLDYIRDDINLTACITTDKFRDFVKVDLKNLRLFKDVSPCSGDVPKERLKIENVITASSENDNIEKHVERSLMLVNNYMVEVLAKHDIADFEVLRDYLQLSKFVNFDYLLIVVWRLFIKDNDFEFHETDIRLYLELICEKLYNKNTLEFKAVQLRCEPYAKLLPKVFARFCNHWTLFNDENALEALACYFAIHFLIYTKLNQQKNLVAANDVDCRASPGDDYASNAAAADDADDDVNNNNNVNNSDSDDEDCWLYNYENAINSGASLEVLCKGFFKKIQSANACLIFNGKHYVAVKKDDDLFKLTEKCSAITMSSVKFNNWKYLYFTDEGVYNLFINSYHSCTPFILGNTLLGALTKKNETVYLPESVINFMLDTGKIENDIYMIYHVAKLCRDVKVLKNNIAMIVAFNNCLTCKQNEQLQLNQLFREMWDFTDRELIIMGVYLNEKKMADLVTNLKCSECQFKQNRFLTKCLCYKTIEIDARAFKVILFIQLFSNNVIIIELAWCLLYNSSLYSKMLADNVDNCVRQYTDEYRAIAEHANFFYINRRKIIDYLYKKFSLINYADELIGQLSNFVNYRQDLAHMLSKHAKPANSDDDTNAIADRLHRVKVNDGGGDNDNDDNNNNNNNNFVVASEEEQVIKNYYVQYNDVLLFLNKWNVWWDKLIVARHNDDLNSWLNRFYMRVILSKVDLQQYSHFFIKNIVTGYLYFRNFTNFNYVTSLLIMHFDASMGIPSDYEKCCVYCTGEPGSGKSSNAEIMENIVVVHKHDAESYTLSKKETDEMEANKLISQLYVINEMKECNDSFFKTTADSTKSNAVCRKYQGSQKYEANYKLMIINNKPLHISNYDKGVRNRFAVIYMSHEFEENLQFSGSIYSHIKTKKYPMEKTYYEGLIKPVRLFLSHILMYKRNKNDGYISYKKIIKNDPIHNHNLVCLDVNNSVINALIYILKLKVKLGAAPVDESKVDKTIELAAPYVEIMIHDAMKMKKNSNRVSQLCADFKKRFKKYYREEERCYYNLNMVFDKDDFNVTAPTFLS